jgi:hypothetical protein
MIQSINLKVNRSENADVDAVINNICIRIHIMQLSLLDIRIRVVIKVVIRYPHMW